MEVTLPRYEYWSTGTLWYWHLVARNGRRVATGGQGFASEAGVIQAINDFHKNVIEAGNKNAVHVHPPTN